MKTLIVYNIILKCIKYVNKVKNFALFHKKQIKKFFLYTIRQLYTHLNFNLINVGDRRVLGVR